VLPESGNEGKEHCKQDYFHKKTLSRQIPVWQEIPDFGRNEEIDKA